MYKIKGFLVFCAISFLLSACGSSASDTSSTEAVKETVASTEETEEKEAEPTEEVDPKEELQKALEDKEALIFFGDVRNDKTGKWRYAMYSESDTQETFAADYYKAFFEDDSEIHALINATRKTTARLTVMDDTIDVTILQYVDGEEHDAALLFSGNVMAEYWVNKETGEVEDLNSDGESEDASAGSDKEKIEEFENKLKPVLESGFDGYRIDELGDTIYFTIWSDQMGEKAKALTTGSSDDWADWESSKASVQDTALAMYGYLQKNDLSDYHVALSITSNVEQEVLKDPVFLSYLDGQLKIDSVTDTKK